jgi:hypothetical protein
MVKLLVLAPAPTTSQRSVELARKSPALLERVRCATLAPNIDSKGRRVRLFAGILTMMSGCLLLLGWALPTGHLGWAALASLGIAAGAFMIFEARASWCVLRALGFRTRW